MTSNQPDSTGVSTDTSTVEAEIHVSVAIDYDEENTDVKLVIDGDEELFPLTTEASSEKVEESLDTELGDDDLLPDVADIDSDDAKTGEFIENSDESEHLPVEDLFISDDKGAEGVSEGEDYEEDLQNREEPSESSVPESPLLDDYEEPPSPSPENEKPQVSKIFAKKDGFVKPQTAVEEEIASIGSPAVEESGFGSTKDIIWLVVIFDIVLLLLLLIAFIAIFSLRMYNRRHKSFDLSNVTYV